jgi:hypothetical protein
VTPAGSRPASRQARAISARTAESPSGLVMLSNSARQEFHGRLRHSMPRAHFVRNGGVF